MKSVCSTNFGIVSHPRRRGHSDQNDALVSSEPSHSLGNAEATPALRLLAPVDFANESTAMPLTRASLIRAYL